MHGSTTQGPRFEYNVTLLGCTPPTTNGTTKTLIVEWNCTSIPGSPKPTKNIFSKILKSSKMCWRTLCFKKYIIIYIYIISSDECSISQGGATWSCKKNASRGLVSPKRKLHCARIRGVFHQVRNSKLTVCILTNDVCKLQKKMPLAIFGSLRYGQLMTIEQKLEWNQPSLRDTMTFSWEIFNVYIYI